MPKQSNIEKLARKVPPDDILHALSVLYEEYSVGSDSEAEVEFWLKCSRATANLSSGMENSLHYLLGTLQLLP